MVTLMDISSSVSGMFSLPVLIILGITVALVSAVTVILYNKIQQQGEKLSAVMELSTVLAQEMRSYDVMIKKLSSSVSISHNGEKQSYPPMNVSSQNTNNIPRIYVSDGAGSSDEEDTDDE